MQIKRCTNKKMISKYRKHGVVHTKWTKFIQVAKFDFEIT